MNADTFPFPVCCSAPVDGENVESSTQIYSEVAVFPRPRESRRFLSLYPRKNHTPPFMLLIIHLLILVVTLAVQEKEIVKIQAFLKANKTREDYRTLSERDTHTPTHWRWKELGGHS